jgi:hypothetical protein
VGLAVEQQRGQPSPSSLTLPGFVGLHPQVALDDIRPELVGVDEDRLGQRNHGRRRDAGLGGEIGGAAPGGAGPRPPGCSERVKAAARLELGFAEAVPDLAGVAGRPLAALDRVEERLHRLLDPEPDPHPLRAPEHLGVERALGTDLRHDRVGQPVDRTADGGDGLGWKRVGFPGPDYHIVTNTHVQDVA